MNLVPRVSNLERQRNIAGLSRERLAHAAGVSERTIRQLEREANVPRLTTQRCIAAALKLPITAIWPSGVDQRAQAERRAA